MSDEKEDVVVEALDTDLVKKEPEDAEIAESDPVEPEEELVVKEDSMPEEELAETDSEEQGESIEIALEEIEPVVKNNWAGHLAIFAIIVVIVAVVLTLFFKQQRETLERDQTRRQAAASLRQKLEYEAVVGRCAEQATSRDLIALKGFEMELAQTLKDFNPQLDQARSDAVKAVSTFDSCNRLVCYLAWDKVLDGVESQAHLNAVIYPHVDPVFKALSGEIEVLVDNLDNELRKSNIRLASDLKAMGMEADDPGGAMLVDDLSRGEIKQALRNLGFDMSAVEIAGGFDVNAVIKSGFSKMLWMEISELSAQVFEQQLLVAGESETITGAVGPLLVSDLVNLGSVIWAEGDAYNNQSEFEIEVDLVLTGRFDGLITDVQKQAQDHALQKIESFCKQQADMGAQSLRDLLGE
jgi:hypothetical protein